VLPALMRVAVAMLVPVKALMSVGVPDRMRRLPAREVAVSTPMRMAVNMRSVPVARLYAHLQTVAWSGPDTGNGASGAERG